MIKKNLVNGIGFGLPNTVDDLASLGGRLETATGLTPWMTGTDTGSARNRFAEARTADEYTPGFGGAIRGFQIATGLDPDGVALPGGPTERALNATLARKPDSTRSEAPVTADDVYGFASAEASGGAAPTAHRPTRPKGGGVQQAAAIRKTVPKAGGAPVAAGAGIDGKPAVPIVPPPAIRQSVGRGGANAPVDRLQAQRNLSRVGFAPRVTERRATGQAISTGLRAYQQAKGLKPDGLMKPGGPTERRLHKQIKSQQRALNGNWAEETDQVVADAKAGTDGTAGVNTTGSAKTLAARRTGARLDAQRAQTLKAVGKGAQPRAAVVPVADGPVTEGPEADSTDPRNGAVRKQDRSRRSAIKKLDPAATDKTTIAAARGELERTLDGKTRSGQPGAFRPVFEAVGKAHQWIRENKGSPRSREEARRIVARAAIKAGLAVPDQNALIALVDRKDFTAKPLTATHDEIYRRLAGGKTLAEAVRAQKAAELRKHARLGDIEHDVEVRKVEAKQRRADALFEERIKSSVRPLLPADKLSISLRIGDETGVLPSKTSGLFTELARTVNPAFLRTRLRETDTAHDAKGYRALLFTYRTIQRLRALAHKNPRVWRQVSPRWRMLAAIVGAAERRVRVVTDDQRVAVMVQTGRVAFSEDMRTVDTWKAIGDTLSLTPGAGEIKEIVDGTLALIDAQRAEARGDKEKASEYRAAAAWHFLASAPLAGAGGKVFRRIGRKLKSASDRHYERVAKDLERRTRDSQGETPSSSKPAGLLRKTTARRDLKRFEQHGLNDDLTAVQVKDVFRSDWDKMSETERKNATFLFNRAKGAAGEKTVSRAFNDAGFELPKKGGRSVELKGRPRRTYDFATPKQLNSLFGLFLFPGAFKGSVRGRKVTVVELKTDAAKLKKQQVITDKKVKKSVGGANPTEVLATNSVIADVRLFRIPIHKIARKDLFPLMQEKLSGKFPPDQVKRMMRDLETFYQKSADGQPIALGPILLFMAAGRTLREETK